MIRAWLVINEFLNSGKFNEIHEWLIAAGRKKGIQLEIKTNAQILISLTGEEDLNLFSEIAFVLFWDKDILLARYLEQQGLRLFNPAGAIEACDHKGLTHLALDRAGIPTPKTILAPMTFDNIGYGSYEFLSEAEKKLRYPMILKECFGSFGQQVYLVKNREECLMRLKKIGVKPFLFQEYIENSFGRDIRLQVVGGEVITSMYRYSENGDFRANITSGGRMKPYTPSDEEKRLAVTCCKLLNLDFAGVDLLFGEGGRPLVCEVNSNAHFKNIYDCTGINTADYIMDYILSTLDNLEKTE